MDHTHFTALLHDAMAAVRSESLALLTSLSSEDALYSLELPALGLDSVELFELIGYLEDYGGITIPEADVFAFKTLGDLHDFVSLHSAA
ncbi:acyl carrier protein [Pseudomonas alabamensis]|uniref:acyl carrier protein n=1 Tax=Pseudomonas alabamensis TaxID=3064349 RepID=UPI003F64D5F0